MVYFKSFKNGYITILVHEADTMEKGTTLKVDDHFMGNWAHPTAFQDDSLHPTHWTTKSSQELIDYKVTKVLLLTSTHHEKLGTTDSFILLGHNILEGHAQWGSSFKAIVESPYCTGYGMVGGIS